MQVGMKKPIVKQVAVFLSITTVISAGTFVWMFSGVEDSIEAVLLMMFTPGISAVLTVLIVGERLKTLGWRLGKARYLLLACLVPLLVSILGYGVAWLSRYADFTTERVVNYRWAEMLGFELPVSFLIGILAKLILAGLVTAVVVFGEEVGWSGFLTLKLRMVASVPVTSIVVGSYWAIWHYPAIVGGFYGTGTPLYVSLPGFTLVLIGASFARTVLVERAGSLWPGVLVHASHNVILMGIFREMTADTGVVDVDYLVSETGVFLGLVYVLVGVFFWRFMKRSEGTA